MKNPPSDLPERLRAAVEAGLGPHHDVEGICAIRVTDQPRLDGALKLTPGKVALAPSAGAARGTLVASTRALEALIDATLVDFRVPEHRRELSFEGDLEFVVLHIVQSLSRPELAVTSALQRAEKASREDPAVAALTDIPRVPKPSPERFREELSRRIPFIVTGALEEWPAADRFAGWAERRARVPLGLLHGEPTLGEFLDRARRQSGFETYSHGAPLPEALYEDFPLPDCCRIGEPCGPQLWIGSSRGPLGLVTPLHRDVRLGVLGHLAGRKHFTVFPPHQAEALYVRPGFDSYQLCWVDPRRPDAARFPRFREAKGIDFVLAPGELLVQPLGWFHCVSTPDPLTASVSYFALF